MLTVAIIARDEERHIAASIESAVALADDLLVLVDPRTTDRTAQIAVAAGAAIHYEPFRSHAAQRNRALDLCRGTWVLFLDADERVTPDLAAEIQTLELDRIEPGQPRYAAYAIPRYNLYWGRRLRGGGWYPDYQVRLLRRGAAHYDERRLIHEFPDLDGPAGQLREHLLHINIESWAELRHKQLAYAHKEAETLFGQGVRPRPHNLLLQPLREAKRRFWTWQGYHDGGLGLLLAATMGYYELVKYIYLWRLARRDALPPVAGA